MSEPLLKDKFILDACCGGRMMWFEKNHPNVVYADVRHLDEVLCGTHPFKVSPDVESDFTNMQFPDNSFKLVVFDPPHLNKLSKNSWLAKKYGVLLPTWETDLKAGFDECMRVLEPFGILIFKWNEVQIPLSKVLALIPYKPLFGHPTAKHGKTKWVCFMKMPITEGKRLSVIT